MPALLNYHDPLPDQPRADAPPAPAPASAEKFWWPPEVRPTAWAGLAGWAALAVALLLAAETSIGQGLDADRFSLMESLVERGHPWVEGGSLSSIDWAKIGPHFYSEKPPLLSLIGAAVYWLLYHGLHLSFAATPGTVVRVMVAVFATVPTLATLAAVQRGARLLYPTSPSPGSAPRPMGGAGLAAAVALGTLLAPYGKAYTNHPAGAACCAWAMVLLLGVHRCSTRAMGAEASASNGAAKGRWAAIGALLALGAAIDPIPAAAMLAVLVLRALASRLPLPTALGPLAPVRLWALLAGAAPVAAAHLAGNRLTLGTWLPGYLLAGRNQYSGSIWSAGSTAASEYRQFATYPEALAHYLAGERGVFLHMPLLALGCWAGLKLLRANPGVSTTPSAPITSPATPPAPEALRLMALAVLSATAATLLLVPAISLGLAGGTYGPRHTLSLVAPLVLLAAAGCNRGWLSLNPFRGAAAWGAALCLPAWLTVFTPLVLSRWAPLDAIAVTAARHWSDPLDGSPAAEFIVRHTAFNPGFAFRELGRAYAEAGHPIAAVKAYRHSLALQPDQPLALYALGATAGRLRQWEPSLAAWQKLTEIEPSNAGAWSGLASTLVQAGQLRSAAEPTSRALQLNPESAAAAFARDTLRANGLWPR